MRDERAVIGRHNGRKAHGGEMERRRRQSAGTALRGGAKGHTRQSFFRKKATKRTRESPHNARCGEDKSRVPDVGHGVFDHSERQRQFAGVRMVVPAVTATQAFRSGPRP